MPSSTVENYLKQIYMLQPPSAGLVPMGELAAAVEVTPGTATSMIKALAESDLVVYEPRAGVRLTEHGRALAVHVLRRHRLIEAFLVQVLKLDWSEVHAEAEVLEHAISDKVLDAIDELLGHPTVDPHGDPIPNAAGEVGKRPTLLLSGAQAGVTYRIARIVDQDASFLKFLAEKGLQPDALVHVEANHPHADAVDLRKVRGRSVLTLGSAAASKIVVEPTG